MLLPRLDFSSYVSRHMSCHQHVIKMASQVTLAMPNQLKKTKNMVRAMSRE